MAESEVAVQLDRAARIGDGRLGVARPVARLGEHILGIWVLAIELRRAKGGLSCLTHQRCEVLG